MDKTDLYVKMSDCPEIQGQRETFEDGDVLASYRQVWKQIDKDTQKASRTFDGILLYDDGVTHVHNRDLVVWLPRQGQIQEMAGYDQPILLDEFYKFAQMKHPTFASYAVAMGSMEQLWLAFYMFEKHGKIWDVGAWVDAKANSKP